MEEQDEIQLVLHNRSRLTDFNPGFIMQKRVFCDLLCSPLFIASNGTEFRCRSVRTKIMDRHGPPKFQILRRKVRIYGVHQRIRRYRQYFTDSSLHPFVIFEETMLLTQFFKQNPMKAFLKNAQIILMEQGDGLK